MTDKPVVIITGVSSGIGFATAKKFAVEGWIVVGTVRKKPYPPELATLAIDLKIAEMAEAKDIERVVAQTTSTYGRIDAVVANAGYAQLGDFSTITHKQWTDQLMINTVAVSDLIRETLPAMYQAKAGKIIIISSVAGKLGLPGYSAYNASKFALEGLGEALSYELKPFNIGVKLIEPSSVKTNFWTTSLVQNQADNSEKIIEMSIANGKRTGLNADKVARIIFASALDNSNKLHYPVGITSWVIWVKKIFPDRWFRNIIQRFL